MHIGAVTTGVLVAAAVVAWLAVLGLLTAKTRTPPIRTGPPTQALGHESPALVDFLTGGWKVSENAGPATLLDLAARRFVAIEAIGPDLSLVRVRREVDTSMLTGYERLVLEHVTELATADGVVATGALAEGARHLGTWRKRFAHAVRDEARAAGLSKPRWSSIHRTILRVAAVLPALGTGLAGELYLPDGDRDPLSGFVGVSVGVFALLVWLQQRIDTEQGTQDGAQVAGRWFGVRDPMAAARFGDQPAAGVTVWGRPLAYAAALGLAERAVASLPISTPPDASKAWSDFGGMWHLVYVRYRGKYLWGRVFWGRSAKSAIGYGLRGALTYSGPILVISILMTVFVGFPGAPIRFALLCVLLIAAGPIVLAVADSTKRTTVQGQILRHRRVVERQSDSNTTYRYWIAIDDGRARTTHAYGIEQAEWVGLAEGDLVEAAVGPCLGWIYDVRVLRPSRYRPSAETAQADRKVVETSLDAGGREEEHGGTS
ncbi:hypothetical protein AB0C34_27580 [Nocardia sp. NPDC049220]|uniref:DUF2207 family protein n=1 Tax=Nocardia sp. NPDC049220 TaxID=3155273 RepID=UPI0033F67ED1